MRTDTGVAAWLARIVYKPIKGACRAHKGEENVSVPAPPLHECDVLTGWPFSKFFVQCGEFFLAGVGKPAYLSEVTDADKLPHCAHAQVIYQLQRAATF